MPLNCLLLTSDAMLLEAFRTGFGGTSVELEMRSDPASAIELSARRHLDGFVIDCDDVSGGADVLTEIRGSRSNKASFVVAVVNGATSVSMAVDAGANFVLGKPVHDGQLRSLLDAAVPKMAREHRRYFRHKVDLPVELLRQTGETFTGKIMNVSEDGLALTRFGTAAVEGVVTVQFTLPSAEPRTFRAKAEIVWNDASAMGLRFLRIELGSRSCFGTWLDSLEAQLQFRESAQPNDDAST